MCVHDPCSIIKHSTSEALAHKIPFRALRLKNNQLGCTEDHFHWRDAAQDKSSFAGGWTGALLQDHSEEGQPGWAMRCPAMGL